MSDRAQAMLKGLKESGLQPTMDAMQSMVHWPEEEILEVILELYKAGEIRVMAR